MKKVALATFWFAVMFGGASAFGEELELNELEYYETAGVNVLVYSNWYNGLFSDSKMSGVEIIHHGVRTATNGDVRLHSTPEQWDAIPSFKEKKVDLKAGLVEAFLNYPAYDFEFSVRTVADGESVRITVVLPEPLPEELEGKAGFNLEFLPAAYFQKSFIMDGKAAAFPLYPVGVKEREGKTPAASLASGNKLVLAPDDPERMVSIESPAQAMALYDGRTKAQNGWFVVRSLLPSGEAGDVLEWTVTANLTDGWLRKPVIAHSQVGYHPDQDKIAVIELDSNDPGDDVATLYRIDSSGQADSSMRARPKEWGRYKRYAYHTFDFSEITEPGVYILEYGATRTAPFRIGADVYDDVWHATLDIFMPVQMDHVLVNEAYRVWHGASHLDDALQAPVNHQHFDLYAQGPTTDTEFEPGQHIPGLNVGGWYDAGDYDIRTQSQYGTVLMLVNAQESFGLDRDTTLVDYDRKYVDLHVPDGRPDLLQQIEHGTIALLAQFDSVGHAIHGIIVPTLEQYTHLGDGLTMTDNVVYNPELGELESNGFESGVFDDRWAFTSKSSALNYGSIAALAAASRALRGYNDELADKCLNVAVGVWAEEQSHEPDLYRHGNTTGGPLHIEQLRAAVELLVTTEGRQYADHVRQLVPEVGDAFGSVAASIVRALPFMDDDYEEVVKGLAREHLARIAAAARQNPFGVPITEGGWAGNGTIIEAAIANYYLYQAFPDLVDKEDVYRGLNYIFGTHPGSDISFVSGVGAQSKTVAYGMNRADFSFIAGGVVPGVLILKPDYPENKEDWPFLWGENEYVIPMGANYIFLANAVDELLTGSFETN